MFAITIIFQEFILIVKYCPCTSTFDAHSLYLISCKQKKILLVLHGPSMLPDKAKFVVCSIISLALSFWKKHLVIGQLQKPATFSAFHWSTSQSRTFIGQLMGTSRVVHLPKRTVMVYSPHWMLNYSIRPQWTYSSPSFN